MSRDTIRIRFGFTVFAGSLLAMLVLSGCVVHHHGDHHTRVVRVPRSAAHGYEHHHRDVVLVFDGSWNGYWVRGRPHHYFYRDTFYRWHGGHWYQAHRPAGPWSWMSLRVLPKGLARHHERADRREERHEHRDEHREARYESREERHEARHERRDDRREARQESREERHEARHEHRDDRREARQGNRDERREARGEQRQAKKRPKDSKQAREKDAYRRGVPANRADD